MNDHRWISAIAALNLIGAIAAIGFSDIWMLLAVHVPIGAMIIGLLFVPRKHLVDRMMTSATARFASLGVGGVFITILLIAARSILKTAKRNDGDFSFLTDLSGIGSVLVSLLVFAACLAVFAFLWKLFGIARVMAAGYIGEFSLLLLSFVTVGAMRGRLERESDQRMQEMQNSLSEMNDPNATMPPGMRSWNGGNQPGQFAPSMNPSARMGGLAPGRIRRPTTSSQPTIRIVLHHELGADVDSFLARLVSQAGITSHRKRTTGKITELTLQYNGTPDELGKMIEGGTVMEVDQELRTIEMDLN